MLCFDDILASKSSAVVKEEADDDLLSHSIMRFFCKVCSTLITSVPRLHQESGKDLFKQFSRLFSPASSISFDNGEVIQLKPKLVASFQDRILLSLFQIFADAWSFDSLPANPATSGHGLRRGVVTLPTNLKEATSVEANDPSFSSLWLC